MAYNSDRGGYETKDGGLIRINGNSDTIRIDVYGGNEREKGGHTRDSINYDTSTGKGSIDSHNADKSESSSTNVGCFLTTACMNYFQDKFDDNCYELRVLRWFRDNFVSSEDTKHYYEIAPIIVETINSLPNCNIIYDYIYDNVVEACIDAIENGNYDFAYNRYKSSILCFEEQFVKPSLEKRLAKTLKLNISN